MLLSISQWKMCKKEKKVMYHLINMKDCVFFLYFYAFT